MTYRRCRVGSAVIVVMDPVLVGRCSGFVGEAGVRVGPFLVEGSVESIDFAVGLRPVGPGPLVLDVRTEGLCE